MITVPQKFVLVEQGPLTLVVREDLRGQLLRCGVDDPERLCAQAGRPAHSGRGSVPRIELDPGTGEHVLVRKYRRGGLLRFLNADIFFGFRRSFDELNVTLAAARAGIDGADMLGAACLRVWGPLYCHYIFSRELSGCCDLPQRFREGMSEAGAGDLARAVAGPVRLMHDSGFHHADLNLKNILVSREDPVRIFIIDWDRSTRERAALDTAQRQRNVVRFCRSAVKLAARGVPVPECFVDVFLDAYWRDSARAAESRQALCRTLRRHRPFWWLQS